MITLDLNHFGFQRAGRPERRKRRRRWKRREEESQTRANLNGGELGGEKKSQASSHDGELDWEVFFFLTPPRVVIEGEGRQARANLNGGAEEPFLRDERGKKDMTWM